MLDIKFLDPNLLNFEIKSLLFCIDSDNNVKIKVCFENGCRIVTNCTNLIDIYISFFKVIIVELNIARTIGFTTDIYRSFGVVVCSWGDRRSQISHIELHWGHLPSLVQSHIEKTLVDCLGKGVLEGAHSVDLLKSTEGKLDGNRCFCACSLLAIDAEIEI